MFKKTTISLLMPPTYDDPFWSAFEKYSRKRSVKLTWFSPAAPTSDLCGRQTATAYRIHLSTSELGRAGLSVSGVTTEMTISGNLDWKDKTSLDIMHFHVEFVEPFLR
ncbi:hypothetical protein V3C99_010387 [Haemonchus contortus]